MVLRVIASDGKKMPHHFIDVGLKVNDTEYLKVLLEVFGPWIQATYPDEN